MPDQFAAVLDDLAESFQRRGGQPGVAYGIVAGGRWCIPAGRGAMAGRAHARRRDGLPDRLDDQELHGGGGAGAAGRRLRWPSMTRPRISCPSCAAWRCRAPTRRAVSLRHLLTMTAGFPTDDPWGTGSRGCRLAEFSAFLVGGLSFAWAPGTRFEYSNLGYAILGRVITAATSQAYPEFVQGPPAPPARADQQRVRGGGIRRPAAGPRATGAGRAGGTSSRRTAAGPSPRWAACSAAWRIWPAG